VRPLPNLPQWLGSAQVIVRFGFRFVILAIFATFSSIGFSDGLSALLWMAIVLCSVLALIRGERVLAAELNHWDETAAYGMLFAFVHGLGS
jgi:hypothetical protein